MPITAAYVVMNHASDSFVEVAPDLVFPKYAILVIENESDLNVDLTIRVVFDRTMSSYVTDSIEVRRRGAWGEVNGQALRSIRVQEYIQRGLAKVVRISRQDGQLLPDRLSDAQASTIKKAGPSNDETLRWVARIYIRAHALNESPLKAVQDQLRLTQPTASVWVRRAKDRGILVNPIDDSKWSMGADEFAIARGVLSDG